MSLSEGFEKAVAYLKGLMITEQVGKASASHDQHSKGK